MTPICRNCDHPLDTAFAFCPACGQKTAIQRLRMAEVLHDFWTQVTAIDRGFFPLLRDLVMRPGIVAAEYIAGKRRKHFGPLNFYLIVGTTLILTINLTEWIRAESRRSDPSEITHDSSAERPTTDGGIIEPTIPLNDSTSVKSAPANTAAPPVSRVQERRQAVSNFWAQYSDFVSLAAAPFLCLVFWLFYRHAGFNYTEMLVACLYMMGFTNLIYALVALPITSALSSSRETTYAITGTFKLFEIGYFTFFLYQLTQDRVRRPILRGALSSVLVAVFWTVLTFALVAFYIMTGFGVD